MKAAKRQERKLHETALVVRDFQLPQVMNCAQSTIDNLRDPESTSYDSSFPGSFSMGPRMRATWMHEIKAWVASKAAMEAQKVPPTAASVRTNGCHQ